MADETPVTRTVALAQAMLALVKEQFPTLAESYALQVPNADTGYRYENPVFDPALDAPLIVVAPSDWTQHGNSTGRGAGSIKRQQVVSLCGFCTGNDAQEVKRTLDGYADLLTSIIDGASFTGVHRHFVASCDYTLPGVEQGVSYQAFGLGINIEFTRAWGEI